MSKDYVSKSIIETAFSVFSKFSAAKTSHLHVYSASMKIYNFWNFDILKIIKGIWAVTCTLHFVFLVNCRHAIHLGLQLGSSCCSCILCFSWFIIMWKHYFQKASMPVYAWNIFLESAIEMVSIIPSNRASEARTFRNHHHLASSHRTHWKHLVFITEMVSCIHVWRTPFSVIPIRRTVHHKNKSWTDVNSLSRKIQMYSCVKCTRVSGNFSLMLSIHAKYTRLEDIVELISPTVRYGHLTNIYVLMNSKACISYKCVFRVISRCHTCLYVHVKMVYLIAFYHIDGFK